MKWLRWISGIALAGLLTIGTAALIMHGGGSVDMNHLTSFQYWIIFLAVPSICFGLFIFLSCTFVSFQKKTAALTVLTLSLIFIALGARQHYMDDGTLHQQYIIRYSAFIIGLLSGYWASYRLYRRANWTRSQATAS